ncbi:glycosyltransferase [Reinekea blandensis]|uniref:Truncated O-antigen biosynthesis protein n=1 Tax=Reinekea blandensis MED297 TaxID=314283 RepID=A4BIY4_9GAMM|nr:glycosyltransferase [Reinekea blandensis]EAR07917.1 truncated O-antigen biosynthesis protein [Reinekea sp. MED297] [Reinekea blandensis MED297]
MISLITVSRSIENLDGLLSTLKDAIGDIPYEVLCSWNGDDSPPVKRFSDINIRFKTIKPYNFSSNNNELAKLAQYSTLLILNDDIEFDPYCIVNALKLFSKPKCGIVGANLRYPDGKVQHAGMFIDEKLMPYHYLKNQADFKDPRINFDREVPAVTGAFMLIDREEFLSIQFDEQCEVAAQDVILCLEYRERYSKAIMYCHDARAIHFENKTRKLFDQKLTPPNDIRIMKESIARQFSNEVITHPNSSTVKLRIVTEKPGWIMHRKGLEIAKRLSDSRINEDFPDANIHYYINYGYFNKRPKHGLVVANFTHFDESLHADKWVAVAKEVDHCVAVSEEAANNLRRFNIPDEKISVIKVGADVSFKPKMTVGIVGRVYNGGRKGEHLVKALTNDPDVMQGLKIVANNDSWGVPVWKFEDMSDFYRAVDFLLVPSLIEGGPVPFMEALATGTLAIAPPIGVIPEFPHIEYKTGDYDSLKSVITTTKKHYLQNKHGLSKYMLHHNWSSWANQHIALFQRLLSN